jgi:mannose-1-phosphate guanylyltransferase
VDGVANEASWPPANFQTFILAGGLGTRLRSLSGSRPKALMPVAGKPFAQRLLVRLAAQGMGGAVLCLGYGATDIVAHFETHPLPGMQVHYSIESEPRGTAGALRTAQTYWADHNLILNGDTELEFDIARFFDYHRAKQSELTMGLVEVADAARFGRVVAARDGKLVNFLEKDGGHTPGLVNAGVYLAECCVLESIPEGRSVSLETEWLPALIRDKIGVYGVPIATAFIDMGTPEDYERLVHKS